ncbi:MAG: hypothetical protein K8R38_10005 [Verrucomicrobia bacterium]|nr:hypothetical protein [Verrucomicrobiota bacterium]
METLLTPPHLHLALNHIPIIGLAVACLPVLVGILFHSRGALASGLLAVVLCAGTMPAIIETGEAAQESFADGSIEPGMDAASKEAFREHSGRAKFTAPVVYAAGILALAALLALIKFPRQAAWGSWAVLLGVAFSIALSIWTAEAGGRIRHPEFRPGTAQEHNDFTKTFSSGLPAVIMETPVAPVPGTTQEPTPAAVTPEPTAMPTIAPDATMLSQPAATTSSAPSMAAGAQPMAAPTPSASEAPMNTPTSNAPSESQAPTP